MTHTLEARLTVLEQRANRYRNAFVTLALTLGGVVLVGATSNEVPEVLMTRNLLVVNEAGQVVITASGGSDENGGFLAINSKTGNELIHAGASKKGDDFSFVGFNKTGKKVVGLFTDEYGNGVVGAFNREGMGRTLRPRP